MESPGVGRSIGEGGCVAGVGVALGRTRERNLSRSVDRVRLIGARVMEYGTTGRHWFVGELNRKIGNWWGNHASSIILDYRKGKGVTEMKRFAGCLLGLALAFTVSTAAACPKEGQTVKTEGTTGKTVGDKAPCGASIAKLTAAKSGCGKDCTKPCCADKSAKLTAGTSGCGKDCTKPCCASQAKLTAKKGGCSKGASLTASGKGECPIGKKVNAVLASLPTIT